MTKQLKACINKSYGCINIKPKPDCRHNKASFSKTHITSSLFYPDKDRLNRSQMSKVVYKASCWDCQDFNIGKTKRRLHDRKTEHFNAITSNSHSSAIAQHVTSTWTILAFQQAENTHCKIKETLLIRVLKPALNETISSEKRYLWSHLFLFLHVNQILTLLCFFDLNLVTTQVNGHF